MCYAAIENEYKGKGEVLEQAKVGENYVILLQGRSFIK